MDRASLDAYAEAIRLNPRKASSHWQRGLLHYQRGRYKEALRDFEAGVRLDPSQEKRLKMFIDACRAAGE